MVDKFVKNVVKELPDSAPKVVGGVLGVAVLFRLATGWEPTRRFMAREPVNLQDTYKTFSF